MWGEQTRASAALAGRENLNIADSLAGRNILGRSRRTEDEDSKFTTEAQRAQRGRQTQRKAEEGFKIRALHFIFVFLCVLCVSVVDPVFCLLSSVL
jgi:hypothetical protein